MTGHSVTPVRASLFPSLVLIGCVLSVPAVAQTKFLVDRTDDGNVGDCLDAVPNDCSLRRATILALLDLTPNVIEVPEGLYTLTIAGDDEDYSATGDLDLWGGDSLVAAPGAQPIIEQQAADRVIEVHDDDMLPAAVSIVGFVIRGGDVTGDGGGITLRAIPDVVIELRSSLTSAASTAAASGRGRLPVLYLQDLEITGNEASGLGGGLTIWTPSSDAQEVEVHGVEVHDNLAKRGGGAVLLGGPYLVESSDFHRNEAHEFGGGLILGSSDATVRDVRIHGNRAAGHSDPFGGGLVAGGLVLIERSSIAWNHVGDGAASTASGGGLSVQPDEGNSSVFLRNTTVASNSLEATGAVTGPQIEVTSDTLLDLQQTTVHDATTTAIHVANTATLRVEASVLDGGCVLEPGGLSITQGYTVERPAAGTSSSCGLSPPSFGDQVVADVLLAAPAVNGGPHGILTMAPRPGSPVGLLVASGSCLAEDARTAPRTLLFCDAGAHESSGTAPGPWIFADGFESGNLSAWNPN